MSELQWCPTPYQSGKFDEYADVGDGLGRFRIRKRTRAGYTGFVVSHNGKELVTESTADRARKYAEFSAFEMRAKIGTE